MPPRFCFSIRHRKRSHTDSFRHRERSVAIPRSGARTSIQFTPSFRAGLPRSLRSLAKTSFFIPSSRVQRGDPEDWRTNAYAIYSVVWRRDCRGRFAPSQRRSFYSVIASAAWRSRRLAYARLLYFFTQIVPLRVYGLDKFYFLCPTARFNRFFGSQRLFYGRKNFVIHATRNVITRRKTFNLMFSMLLDTPVQIARNPRI